MQYKRMTSEQKKVSAARRRGARMVSDMLVSDPLITNLQAKRKVEKILRKKLGMKSFRL
jgi:hypothetical protein